MKVGDKVLWSSQANGSVKIKGGKIEYVIPANTHAKTWLSGIDVRKYFSLRTDFCGLPRDHKSYLISVPGKSDRAKRLLYWPRVSALKPDNKE